MQIKSKTDLDSFFKMIEKKAEEKMTAFLNEFLFEAIDDIAFDKNPLGDSIQYSGFYASRKKLYGFKEQEGLSSNNWLVTLNSPSTRIEEIYGDSSSKAINSLDSLSTVTRYKLGDTVYVVNNVPYIDEITEKGSGGNISNSASDWLEATVKDQATVMRYFQAGAIAADRVNYAF